MSLSELCLRRPTNCCIPDYLTDWIQRVYSVYGYLSRRCEIKKSIEACHVNVKMTINTNKNNKYVMMLLMFTFKINNLVVVYLNRIGCDWYGMVWYRSIIEAKNTFSDWLPNINNNNVANELWVEIKRHSTHTHTHSIFFTHLHTRTINI